MRNNLLAMPTHKYMCECNKMMSVVHYNDEKGNHLQKVVWNKNREYKIGFAVIEGTLRRKADEIVTNVLEEIIHCFPEKEMNLYETVGILFDPYYFTPYNDTNELNDHEKNELNILLKHFHEEKAQNCNRNVQCIVDRKKIIVEYGVIKIRLFELRNKYTELDTTTRMLHVWNVH